MFRLLTGESQFSYRLENKRRNALHGVPDDNTRVDTSELADKVCISP